MRTITAMLKIQIISLVRTILQLLITLDLSIFNSMRLFIHHAM